MLILNQAHLLQLVALCLQLLPCQMQKLISRLSVKLTWLSAQSGSPVSVAKLVHNYNDNMRTRDSDMFWPFCQVNWWRTIYIYKAGELVELVGYSITYDINHDATIPMITIPYYTYNNGWRGLYSLYTSIHRRDRWEVAVPRWGHPCCPWRVWMFISANGCPNGWYSIV